MDPHESNLAAGFRRRRARIRVIPADAPLRDHFRQGYQHLEVMWRNPYTSPPDGLARVQWACAIPIGISERAFTKEHAPKVVPGSGWCYSVGTITAPGPAWSKEAKARVRRGNLRRRLEKSIPLFAAIAYDDELARRPDYFAGEDLAMPLAPMPAPASSEAPKAFGHNGGPPLDPE